MLNLKIHFNMEEELPTTPEAIKDQFGEWLAKATKPVILIIDGFNQLQETEITRGWWHYIPAKTHLFVSSISAENLPAEWQKWKLALLTEESARQALITEYLQQYGKRLADKPMQDLLAHSQTANPLYLQVILEELRVFGEFDKLEDHLKGYLKTKTIPALYEKVLARLEADYEPSEFPHLVADSLSLLWAARQGLNEAELLKILDIPQAVWSPLYLALQNALVSRGGLLSFFHDYLKQAVENRYLLSREKQPSSYFSKIISLLYSVLSIREKVLGPEHPNTASYLMNLAALYDAIGDYDHAKPLYQRALEILEKVLGAEHPNTVTVRNNLETCRAKM
jgi:nephrocystin-3